MTPDAAPGRRPGRPRDAGADRAILTATVDVLQECGLAAFTVDAVAARAGVGKATIYRRWPCKGDLVSEAVASLLADAETPDTGTVRGDLVALGTRLVAYLSKTPAGCLAPQLMASATHDPEMRALVRSFAAARRAPALDVVRRAMARGELPAGTDPDTVVDAVVGLLFYRLLVTGGPVSRQAVARIVDLVLDGAR